MTAVTHGRDEVAAEYLRQGVSIGQRMGLFDAGSRGASAAWWLEGHDDWTKAASYTAWGVFNWAALVKLPRCSNSSL